jgi:hypothetical protein
MQQKNTCDVKLGWWNPNGWKHIHINWLKPESDKFWHLMVIWGCKYVDRNQRDYFTKGLTILFIYFSYEWIFEWIFLQLVIKNTYSCPNTPHISCYSLLNKYEFFKVCKFCQILDFILKIYHNIESYKNMLTILDSFFLY